MRTAAVFSFIYQMYVQLYTCTYSYNPYTSYWQVLTFIWFKTRHWILVRYC